MQIDRIKIISETELEPATPEITVEYDNGTRETGRINVFDLATLKKRLGLPVTK